MEEGTVDARNVEATTGEEREEMDWGGVEFWARGGMAGIKSADAKMELSMDGFKCKGFVVRLLGFILFEFTVAGNVGV